MRGTFAPITNFSGSDQQDDDAPPVYTLEKLKVEEDFAVQKAPNGVWSALKSSIFPEKTYKFLLKEPFDYIDYKQRYLV